MRELNPDTDKILIKLLVKLSFFLEDSVVIEKDGYLFVVSSEKLFIYEEALKRKIYINHEKSIPDLPFFSDWYSYITDYDRIENLINDKTVKIFGNIKTVFEGGEYRCHINSKEYWGHGNDKRSLKFAVVKAMIDAIKNIEF